MSRNTSSNSWGDPHTLLRERCLIHYWVVGPENAPVVILTHGASMDHRMFDDQLDPLLNAGYCVLTWDVRGHGLSKPIGTQFNVPVVVDDLVAILDQLEINQATLVGQSFGGYVSQELLFRHPERVTAVGIIGATDITSVPPRLEQLALKLSSYLFKIWPDRHLRTVIADYTAENEDVKQYAYNATRQLSKSEFITVWKGVASALHDEPEYRIHKPLLVTHGELDKTGTIARDAPSWAKREPTCRYEVIPDAGHNANHDNPDWFNRVLVDFLMQHVPSEEL